VQVVRARAALPTRADAEHLCPIGATAVLSEPQPSASPYLAMRGASPKAIQELMGHEHLTTTMRYMHLSPSARRGAIDLLNGRESHGATQESSPRSHPLFRPILLSFYRFTWRPQRDLKIINMRAGATRRKIPQPAMMMTSRSRTRKPLVSGRWTIEWTEAFALSCPLISSRV
jgi:hypothetical protein